MIDGELRLGIVSPQNPFLRAQEVAFSKLVPVRTIRAQMTLGQLYLLEQHGIIGPDKTKRIVEFGAGFGDGTAALGFLAEKYGARLDAVEAIPERARFIVEDGILVTNRVHVTDGIGYLKRTTSESVDLVFAQLFGPDPEGYLFSELLQASGSALSADGSLVISSDSRTIFGAKDVCRFEGVDYLSLPEVQTQEYFSYGGVVVNRDNCRRFYSR